MNAYGGGSVHRLCDDGPTCTIPEHLEIRGERCFAVVGDARGGPAFCGYSAKSIDANGRPVCGVHKKGNHGILWYGDRYRYPEGTAGRWKFAHGEPRSQA